MKIIGIDPGINRTGYGIIEYESDRFTMVEYGCLSPNIKKLSFDRLASICDQMDKVLEKHKPEIAVIEDVFYSKNAKSALVLGHIRGALIITVARHGIRLEELTPLEIKKGITGYGRAEKQQVGEMVRVILGLKNIPEPADSADALAGAIAFALRESFSRKVEDNIN
jgi:crossover junction endodeoxyribonuclease RuvC